MKLTAFSVRNYRSITTAYKLPVRDYTVLVGPNNEGKSNILKAMVLGLNLLSRGVASGRRYRTFTRLAYRQLQEFDYEWARDFPVALREAKPEGYTELTFELVFSDREYERFRERFSSKLATNLRLRLKLGAEDARIEVVIQGRGKQRLDAQVEDVARFVGERLLIQYVPAQRSSQLALRVVDQMLRSELVGLQKKEEYRRAVEKLRRLQRPVLERIQSEIATTMKSFLPDLRTVELKAGPERLSRALGGAPTILIDDGTRTELEMKGDGIQSLAALSLLRHVSQESLGERNLILAVEEPESHLHPDAVHELKRVMQEMAGPHQVVMTTHSPVLVDRLYIGRNILVGGGKAAEAQRIAEIRSALGVRVSDNLSAAYLVLLVEGATDETIVREWLKQSNCAEFLASGALVVERMGGASRLSSQLPLFRSQLCNVHVLLDNDREGREAIEVAMNNRSLDDTEYTLLACPGMRNSELEDLFAVDSYQASLEAEFGIALRPQLIRSRAKKWSCRIESCFRQAGKLWNKGVKSRVKHLVANEVSKKIDVGLRPERRASLDALLSSLERHLRKMSEVA